MKRLLMVLAVVAMVVGAGQAQANPVIALATGNGWNDTASIWWDGTVLVGNGIPLTVLTTEGADQNNGTFGANAQLSFWYDFSNPTAPDNNYIKVVGGVPSASVPNGTVLAYGTFDAAPYVDLGDSLVVFFNGTDMKSTALLTWLGLPDNYLFTFSGCAVAEPYQMIRGLPIYHGFYATFDNTAVPEPGSMLLLGSGLFGLASVLRRRAKK